MGVNNAGSVKVEGKKKKKEKAKRREGSGRFVWIYKVISSPHQLH